MRYDPYLPNQKRGHGLCFPHSFLIPTPYPPRSYLGFPTVLNCVSLSLWCCWTLSFPLNLSLSFALSCAFHSTFPNPSFSLLPYLFFFSFFFQCSLSALFSPHPSPLQVSRILYSFSTAFKRSSKSAPDVRDSALPMSPEGDVYSFTVSMEVREDDGKGNFRLAGDPLAEPQPQPQEWCHCIKQHGWHLECKFF